ncbi:hypothetical protein ACFYUD_32205 [Nocardia tengchongensis]|uniref:hypothetical protein n=1 Tax=Nocardia tengchongensis TaxID=2055889 RepID=UPI0036D15382
MQELLHGPMIASLPPPLRPSDLTYGLSTVGHWGRIVDRQLFAALGWSDGDRLGLRTEGAVLVAEPATDVASGALMVVRAGFVRVSYRWRRRVNLFLGDRVLLLANPFRKRLAIYAPTALAEVFGPVLDGLSR